MMDRETTVSCEVIGELMEKHGLDTLQAEYLYTGRDGFSDAEVHVCFKGVCFPGKELSILCEGLPMFVKKMADKK